MRERWLQSLWGKQDWNGWPLRTYQGQSIRVLHPGKWNNDQGPDFLGAQIFIDQVLWVGAVEIHVHSVDWFRHHHTADPNYLPVILHVVWMQVPLHPDIPTLELSRYLTVPKLKQTLIHLGDIGALACHRILRPVPADLWSNWRSHLLSIRHQRKMKALSGGARSVRTALARQLGAWVNREVFESIDASISNELLEAACSDLTVLTALYIGQAGLLDQVESDPVQIRLQEIYREIRSQHALNPPYRSLLWMRIRPAAAPTIRLMQLAALIHQGWHQLSNWQHSSASEITRKLSQTTGYVHVRSANASFISTHLIEQLLINIWSYQPGTNPNETERSLRSFGFEENRFTRLYAGLSITDPTAADSQALLELHHSYCEPSRCAQCTGAKYWVQDQPPQSI